MNIQTLKGFRDFLPLEARKRQYLINTLKKVFESYGFEPLETPVLEYDEILTGKYGEEGEKLMYRFEDNGKRKVAMRYDQTVPTARVVAQYQNELPMPFKRYQVQPVWRAENTQKGRYREFLQFDADIIGTNSRLADAEILAVVYEGYKKLGLDIVIKVNDRALLKEIPLTALPTLDKLNKIGEEGVLKELTEKNFSIDEAKSILNQVKTLKPSLYLQEVLENYEQMGNSSSSWEFDSTLVRGLDYYTGIIFEIVLKSDKLSSSLCGGGRYDRLIGMFAKKNIPAVGFAIGFDRTLEAMEELNLFPESVLQTSKVLVTIFSSDLANDSLKIANQLRENNINTEIYLDLNSKLDKQLKYADAKGIPYAIILGPDEISKQVIILKDLKNRTQQTLSLDEALKILQTK